MLAVRINRAAEEEVVVLGVGRPVGRGAGNRGGAKVTDSASSPTESMSNTGLDNPLNPSTG